MTELLLTTANEKLSESHGSFVRSESWISINSQPLCYCQFWRPNLSFFLLVEVVAN